MLYNSRAVWIHGARIRSNLRLLTRPDGMRTQFLRRWQRAIRPCGGSTAFLQPIQADPWVLSNEQDRWLSRTIPNRAPSVANQGATPSSPACGLENG